MSTRFLGLISTTAVAALAVTGYAAQTHVRLSAAHEPVLAPRKTAGPPAPSASPKVKKDTAKDGKNLDACLDADCEVEVESGQRIPLDPKYGVNGIDVRTDGPRVVFTANGRNSKMVTSMDATIAGSGSSSTVNGLTFRPRMTKDGRIIVQVTHD
ncbi:hypothetical protein F8568_034925 [Actinomadura sp. LD22]|uniref:Uncharacterized protein n=1 Tax=Actinomadura physcomitrii TaxID=2650748 RepID=A0A6I4MKP6_9ACTN|nr:hypothetical protein [Actinomadura physcomitrii]MWA05470.1 hypothetical protein [Actinomadura physcomitrii]